MSESDNDGILNNVTPHTRPHPWDLDAFLGRRIPVSTDGTAQRLTHTARNEVNGEESASLTSPL
ncbi:hypothetical protein GC170_04070 [bacterium]|nr:hypothetical protein [bacterium]